MAAPKTGEDSVKHCHRCGKEFEKHMVRVPTYREGRFWFECLDCFQKLGGVTWARNRKKQ